MHNRPFRKDVEATKARHFTSRYSYVSQRIHPGTDHQCEYLAGLEDVGKRRMEVFERDGYKCMDCGRRVSTATQLDPWSANMAHGGNTKISRCDCPDNLKTKCRECHGANDHHGRF